jgi:hypothetical protein
MSQNALPRGGCIYDPTLGIWYARDPIKESGGPNLYMGFAQNPLRVTDRLGLWNVWNPATWGVGVFQGADSFNPLGDSAMWDSYHAEDALQGAEAFVDGLIPFADPFADNGFYDPCSSLKYSKRIGVGTGIAELGLAGGAAAFSTGGETAIFYPGHGSRQAAIALAEEGAGKTIFDTVGGQLLDKLGASRQAWEVASWFFANAAPGREAAVVITAGGGGAGTVLAEVEVPALAARGFQLLFY